MAVACRRAQSPPRREPRAHNRFTSRTSFAKADIYDAGRGPSLRCQIGTLKLQIPRGLIEMRSARSGGSIHGGNEQGGKTSNSESLREQAVQHSTPNGKEQRTRLRRAPAWQAVVRRQK